MHHNSLWITWERQRRSIELSRALDAELCIFSSNFLDGLPFCLRYPVLILKTLKVLIVKRPKQVFAQNPSLVLAAILCIYKPIFRYILIVDRHSNFKLDKKRGVKWRLFHLLSRFTIRCANLTIVTNVFLAELVNRWGGNSYILQDKLPDLSGAKKMLLSGRSNVACISSFGDDEPIKEIIGAARIIEPSNIRIYITGNNKKYEDKRDEIGELPQNVTLTGFLDESEYQRLLASVDIVLVLTKQDHTLNCGAYEAVSLGKPMVLSDKVAIKKYFSSGAIFCDPEHKEQIARAIRNCIENEVNLVKEVGLLKSELIIDWQNRYRGLVQMLDSFQKKRPSGSTTYFSKGEI